MKTIRVEEYMQSERIRIAKLSDEELIRLYKKGLSSAEIWKDSGDGNYECVYYTEVYPYEKELERRGIRL